MADGSTIALDKIVDDAATTKEGCKVSCRTNKCNAYQFESVNSKCKLITRKLKTELFKGNGFESNKLHKTVCYIVPPTDSPYIFTGACRDSFGSPLDNKVEFYDTNA